MAKVTENKTTVKEKEVKKALAKEELTTKKVLIVTSEASPFIRSGGLGDVAGALPKELAANGIDVRVVLPLYKDISSDLKHAMNFQGYFYVSLAWRYQYCGIFKYELDGVTYYFLDNEYYFNRGGLYGYYDDAERYAFFSKATIDMLATVNFKPDIIHANDWHTALVPVYLDAMYRGYEFFRDIKTVFTIHNIQFQGKYGKEIIREVLGLPEDTIRLVEYEDCVNFMKGAIECSNVVTTVSPTYAKEIFDPFFSYGLDKILRERSFKVRGIVNGIDQNIFNPTTDKSLFRKYSINDVQEGKKANKDSLLKMLDLAPTNDAPLIGMVTRLTEQKGVDIVIYAMESILQKDVRLVILGQGDWKFENSLLALQERYKSKLRVSINFSGDLANKIYAASDLFLMPSKFEPCGLSQLIAMRYGTVPIVRLVGGLKDTVPSYNPTTGEGLGFTFYDYNHLELLGAINRALDIYYQKDKWDQLVNNNMKVDNSWKKSAKEYIDLYNSIS